METVVMDADLKTKIKSDLENFLKSKQYYHWLGRVWKRSYLLYGPSGTEKSTFIAAMAKFLSYDIYEIDLIVIENLDQYFAKINGYELIMYSKLHGRNFFRRTDYDFHNEQQRKYRSKYSSAWKNRRSYTFSSVRFFCIQNFGQ
ncbi:P-loop containing nucleoside triphosphate hydrolase superfamily protein [Abeliophyllum distichum]|uniref:P-loop containing nucleoside triphosphate hydrolase superfamily protein n=1 Tax=Abeliophyllum distichum TaxID=126358 RepID=A0ABD1SCN7_9LAMI